MSTTGKPNILLIIADDLGKDVVKVSVSGSVRKMQVINADNAGNPIVGELPTVSRLLRNGVYFRQAWAQPACSPTRGSIYTGTHPWRNGIGSPYDNPELANSGTSLPQVLPATYQCGLFGKWHLGKTPPYYPTDHGWHKHVGTLGGVVDHYYNWTKDDSDDYTLSVPPVTGYTTYATWDTVNEAAAWVRSLNAMVPWFLTLAFHTPHDPFNEPPLGTFSLSPYDPTSNDHIFNAMAQNMDYNIGRLLGMTSGAGSGIGPIGRDGPLLPGRIAESQLENTVIIFIGDNGSVKGIALQEEKTTVYEGGVRVPMIIADGRAVMQAFNQKKVNPFFVDATKLNFANSHLAHVVDLYRTIGRIAGTPAADLASGLDSFNLLRFVKKSGIQSPVRTFNFSQWFSDTHGTRATIRNRAYKLNYDASATSDYELFEYQQGRVPGQEDDGTATDLYNGGTPADPDAVANLATLLTELQTNYNVDSAGTVFP